MKRNVVLPILKAALLLGTLAPGTAWAVSHWFNNQFGTVSISYPGVVSKGSELTAFGQIVPTKGHSLGSVNFTVGPLLAGSIAGGGDFSDFGSSFIVTGNGNQGVPKGPIFVGAFKGKVHWKLISQDGQKMVFHLNGRILGYLYDGRMVELASKQTIVTTEAQLGKGVAHIQTGRVIGYP